MLFVLFSCLLSSFVCLFFVYFYVHTWPTKWFWWSEGEGNWKYILLSGLAFPSASASLSIFDAIFLLLLLPCVICWCNNMTFELSLKKLFRNISYTSFIVSFLHLPGCPFIKKSLCISAEQSSRDAGRCC